MVHYKLSDFINKQHWIHLVFWLLYSIYLFGNPPLYKWGVLPVIYMAIAFYLIYGGAYVFTIKVISPQFFQKKKIGKGLLAVLATASVQQLLFQPISNYFLPFNNPFLEWFFFNLPFSCLILLLAAGVSVFTDYLYVIRQVQTLELIKARQEIFLLKSQINPHFLFNTLNNLYALTKSKSDKAEVAILQLSGLMRYLIEISQREFVPLSDEINFLTNYIEMEKLRLNDDAICNFHISPNNFENYKVPPMLLLPFVENAFKHGAELNPDKIEIQFYLALQENTLYFEANNSVASAKPKINSGTGLINIKKRLQFLFEDNYKLELIHLNNKYTAKLSINLV